jgi:hypothetical protein
VRSSQKGGNRNEDGFNYGDAKAIASALPNAIKEAIAVAPTLAAQQNQNLGK